MEAAEHSAPTLRVGCPMWAFKPWIGSLYPLGTPQNRLLGEYARSFDTVEGNTTFYALPEARTVARWAEQAPENFRFVLKMPKRITHELRLRDAHREVAEFVERFEPLADRLGPTFVQLPASFGPDDLGVLHDFLAGLPGDREWALEVRHRDFFVGGRHEQPLDEMLRRLAINRVIMDARCVHAGPSQTPQERDEIRSKPNLPVRPVSTGCSPIIRFIGQTDPSVHPAFWAPWVDVCRRWLAEGLSPYVFIHTPDNLATPRLAVQFQDEVGGSASG
ncbi:MAG: DUF72 domain-containing protein [Actinomycetota bacterium]